MRLKLKITFRCGDGPEIQSYLCDHVRASEMSSTLEIAREAVRATAEALLGHRVDIREYVGDALLSEDQ